MEKIWRIFPYLLIQSRLWDTDEKNLSKLSLDLTHEFHVVSTRYESLGHFAWNRHVTDAEYPH